MHRRVAACGADRHGCSVSEAPLSLAEQLRARLRELKQSSTIPPNQQKPVAPDETEAADASAAQAQVRYGDMEPSDTALDTETEAQRHQRIYDDPSAWLGSIGKFD